LTITASAAANMNCKFGSAMFGSVFTQHTVTMNASPPRSVRSVCERTRFKPFAACQSGKINTAK
jgi:hypothetical protein